MLEFRHSTYADRTFDRDIVQFREWDEGLPACGTEHSYCAQSRERVIAEFLPRTYL